MSRSRGYYREMRKRAIQKKKGFLKRSMRGNMPHELDANDIFNTDYTLTGSFGLYWYVKHDGELSKGKIHCSCGMCGYHDTPMQDKKRLMEMSDELDELYEMNVSSDVVKPLKNKIRQMNKTKYYPNSGIKGTTLNVKSTADKSEFDQLIHERNNGGFRFSMFGWLTREYENICELLEDGKLTLEEASERISKLKEMIVAEIHKIEDNPEEEFYNRMYGMYIHNLNWFLKKYKKNFKIA